MTKYSTKFYSHKTGICQNCHEPKFINEKTISFIMTIAKINSDKKKLNVDLLVIISISLIVLVIFILFSNPILTIVRDNSIHILLRLLLVASLQFGLAGLGITIVSIVRKENFLSYGLRMKNSMLSIVLCGLCCIPSLIFTLVTTGITSYLPFQSVWTTSEVLASGIPISVIGILITAIAWGFFEGFNYVVISSKINKRFKSKYFWLNWGAIICAIMCILVHGIIGINPESIFEMITTMILIYGMLIVYEWTGNAWGPIFIFLFFWNAI